MKPINIMYTAAGAPQAATLIKHLKNNGEKPVRLIGLDMNKDVIGRFLSDDFEQIPKAGSDNYKETILQIIKKHEVDAFLNCSGTDVPFIASMKDEIEALGAKVLAPDVDILNIADNKYSLYKSLQGIKDVKVPDFCSPKSLDEFVKMAYAMGYPKKNLCFKPHISKGSRGFRVLTEQFDQRDLLLNHKPTARYMSLDEFISIFKNSDDFPNLLLMEVAEGEEVDAMTIGYSGEALLTTVKSRESHRWGIIDKGRHVDRPNIVKAVKAIIKKIPLDYNISIQFIDEKIIEINPRTSTFIFQEDLNEPWLAIKLALGIISPQEVKACQKNVEIGYSMIRYMDQIFVPFAGVKTL